MSDQVRVRIAPSPTGDPHVGTAYVALFNYCFAKQRKGKFILRIEDTDQERAKSSSEASIFSSLSWLGLQWDEGPDVGGPYGPYRQSERKEIYKEYAEVLLKSKGAYRCFCSKARLDDLRAQQRLEGLPPKYDGFCLSLSEEEISTKLKDATSHVIRLKMPREGSTKFTDELRGGIEFENHRIDDQVLMKSDGFPTYHLANVVDDHLMKITHVIRAEEWISSTPKHVQLYRAFGWKEPTWVHLPLLRNADKSKISKRKNPVSLNYYRRAGILPQAMLNFLCLMGWNPGGDQELFGLDLIQEKLDLSQINLGGPVFDVVKLNWMNQHYIQKLSSQEFSNLLRNDFFSDEYLRKIHPLVVERLSRFEDFVQQNSFFFNGALDYTGLQIVPKGMELQAVKTNLRDLIEILDEVYDWTASELEKIIEGQRNKLGLKPPQYLMPLRLITTGRKDSPPLFQTLEVLGREMVRYRLRDGESKITQ